MVIKFTKASDKTTTGVKVAPWMKRGKAAQEAIAYEENKASMAASGQAMRFWLKDGEEASITFLDGKLDEDGALDIPSYYEHSIQMNGTWGHNFVCVDDGSPLAEPCPICEDGDKRSLVGLLTIIDHREIQGAKQVYKDEKRLYVVKLQTIKQLQKLAQKRGGSLAGCTFDVSRVGDKAPRVGNMFDFTDKVELTDEMTPFDYDKVIERLPAKELRKLGLGSEPVGAADASGIDDEI